MVDPMNGLASGTFFVIYLFFSTIYEAIFLPWNYLLLFIIFKMLILPLFKYMEGIVLSFIESIRFFAI